MEALPSETWRDIPGFEGMYQASTHGRVRSLDREVPRKGSTFRLKGRVLRPFASKTSGYLYVSLGAKQRAGVHTAVLSAFVSTCLDGMECCHKDGDKYNNAVSNLRWGTHAENEQHKRRHGTQNIGARNGSSKLRSLDVVAIRQEYAKGGVRLEDLGARYGVTASTIGYIIRRKTWVHIDDHGDPIRDIERTVQ